MDARPQMVSRLRKWARSLVPLGIVELVRAKRTRPPQLWDGIFDNHAAVRQQGSGYRSAQWIAPQADVTTRTAVSVEDARETLIAPQRYLLLPACAAVLFKSGSTLRVLDFGGAMGIAYPYFRTLVVPGREFEYYVVDNEESCSAGRVIFNTDPRVRFVPDLSLVPAADVIFLSGVLQYIPDFRQTILDLAQRFEPAAFVLTLTPVGNFPTFASAQTNLEGSILPAWFFNHDEFVELFALAGYDCALRSGAELAFDMGNFPESHRLKAMSNWVFSRRASPGRR
jgi:putative methyltransferase (TIGR04325 family)